MYSNPFRSIIVRRCPRPALVGPRDSEPRATATSAAAAFQMSLLRCGPRVRQRKLKVLSFAQQPLLQLLVAKLLPPRQ